MILPLLKILFLVAYSTADMNIAIIKDINLNSTISNHIEYTVASCKMRCVYHSDCASIGIKEISITGLRPFVCFLLKNHTDAIAHKMTKEKNESEKMVHVDEVSTIEMKENGCSNKVRKEISPTTKPPFTQLPAVVTGTKPVYSYLDKFTVEEGKKLFVLQRLYKTYTLKFELKLYRIQTAELTSIIRLTTGNDFGSYGDRTPAIFLNKRHRLLIASSSVNHQNVEPELVLKTDRWYKIVVSQKRMEGIIPSYSYRIVIDDDLVYKTENRDARELTEVSLYASDPWYDPNPKGQLRKVELYTSPA